MSLRAARDASHDLSPLTWDDSQGNRIKVGEMG